MIEEAKRTNPQCRCEKHGLAPGLTVRDLVRVKGCKDIPQEHPRYVCPTLDKVRRLMQAA